MSQKVEIRIGDNIHPLKLTLGSWKRLKEDFDITPSNFQQRMEEDSASVISAFFFCSLPVDVRVPDTQKILDEEFELNIKTSRLFKQLLDQSSPQPSARGGEATGKK
jgi:hypothetical protein